MNPANDKLWDVITVGDVFTDLVFAGLPDLPKLGEEAFAQSLHRDIGGGAAITASGLAKLGLRTAIIASVGKSDSKALIEQLQSCGVTTDYLHFHPTEPTALTVAASTAQDRAFLTYAGANLALPEKLASRELEGILTQARHVHFACPLELGTFFKVALALRASDTTMSIDVGWHPDWLRKLPMRRALMNANWFFPNEREAAWMTREKKPERMLAKLYDLGLQNVVIKLGAQGSATMREGEMTHVPAPEVEPLETTGAGDCFDAGFLFAWLNGESIKACLRWGNICGALSTRASGGLLGFPTYQEARSAS